MLVTEHKLHAFGAAQPFHFEMGFKETADNEASVFGSDITTRLNGPAILPLVPD